MAINFYGACKGTSSSKYDLWINAVQNSQNVNNNQSNVTLKFYIRRNDGYSDSAYNLYEAQNTVKITVGDNVVVNKNIKIDTRNNVSCLLASWTGNLTHSDDGKLSVSLNAQFTMDNTSLSSGSVSATLTCTAIPRKSTLSLSSLTVNPGGNVTATITAASSGFSHKIKWSLGEKSTTISLVSGVLTSTIAIPVEWVNEVTDSSKATISVSLITYNGSTKTGTNVYSLSLIIPSTDEYKPEFSVGLTRIDNGVPAEWGEYVQGVSKVSVYPQGLTFKYGASLSAITITVGSVSVRGKEKAEFNLTESGELTVTVAVRDTRGILTVKKSTLSVCPYSPPSAQILRLLRCNEDGVADTYGSYLFTEYALKFSSVNSKNTCRITAKYKTASDADYSEEQELTTTSAVFGGGNISVNNSVEVCYTVCDSISQAGTKILRSVSSANIPFNIRNGGKGAAFGKFAENENELLVAWNLSVDGDVNIGGRLNYESVCVACSEKASEVAGVIRYYPFVNGCYVRIRLKTAVDLSAGGTYTLAHISDKPPAMFTPLRSFSLFSSGGVSVAGVSYETGDVVFRSDVDVPAGTSVYISGFYLME